MIADHELEKQVLHSTADNLSGNTPIMLAAIENKIQFMERLVALGCSVNKTNKENYIALHFGTT